MRLELIELYSLVDDQEKLKTVLEPVKVVAQRRKIETLLLDAALLHRDARHSEACDLWLDALQLKPSKAEEWLSTMIDDFDRADRIVELIDKLRHIGVSKFASGYLGTVLEKLRSIPVARDRSVGLLLEIMDSERLMRDFNRESFFWFQTSLWLDHEEVLRKQIESLLSDSLKNGSGKWSKLFVGNRYLEKAGPHSPLTWCIEKSRKSPERLAWIEQKILDTVNQHPEWFEGQLALGIFAARHGNVDRAQKLLSVILEPDFKPVSSGDALWCIGGQIDSIPALRPLAVKMYKLALQRLTANQRNVLLLHPLQLRLSQLLISMDRQAEAIEFLELLLQQHAKGLESLLGGEHERSAQLALQSTVAIVRILMDLDASRTVIKSLGHIRLPNTNEQYHNYTDVVHTFISQMREARAALKAEGVLALPVLIDTRQDARFAVNCWSILANRGLPETAFVLCGWISFASRKAVQSNPAPCKT